VQHPKRQIEKKGGKKREIEPEILYKRDRSGTGGVKSKLGRGRKLVVFHLKLEHFAGMQSYGKNTAIFGV